MIPYDLSEIAEATISKFKEIRQRDKLESLKNYSKLPAEEIYFCGVERGKLFSLFHKFTFFEKRFFSGNTLNGFSFIRFSFIAFGFNAKGFAIAILLFSFPDI